MPGDPLCVTGGATRTASVRAGLDALADTPPNQVFIHDGARPFLDRGLILPLITALETHDGAVPALPIADALKRDDFSPVDRDALHRVQTPQAFDYAKIKMAFDALPIDASAHDDISVARDAGLSLAFTKGSESNFKVTWPEDFAKAEAMLAPRTFTVTGSGFDVHKLAISDDPLWLCGIQIDSPYTLVGHSDADVGLHALHHHHQFVVRPRIASIRENLRPIMAIALPAIATQLATPFAIAYMTRITATFGDDAVADPEDPVDEVDLERLDAHHRRLPELTSHQGCVAGAATPAGDDAA